MAQSELEEFGAEENAQRPEREAGKTAEACWGCCGTSHNGSRQPSKGDSGVLGGTPSPEPPKRNATKGYHRPGAYTPMGKLHWSAWPEKDGQVGAIPGQQLGVHSPVREFTLIGIPEGILQNSNSIPSGSFPVNSA
ncbi:hypothetical protein JD844_003854 [Phrynosoma platyrhinos]|uniref:Uncharacterized protein n=1 Tax=Phrynosoma platyrhinos TaxID=52577 RepID=A0ABQ7TDL6_PHRPL|nr:hypothetical protein JD844_003854 [Phrynosoma platyrhinos]